MTELLMPCGNTEAFYAAVEGGADAIFAGMKNFNARGRATNFTPAQYKTLVEEAHSRNVKVYITLNTVIRNDEISELINTLNIISKLKADAIIIQDWGVYYLAKRYFPKLVIHASTQMANHNSLGANYSKKIGIDRVILARELTMPELNKISQNTKNEIEIFVHGALCYSFSGMCLFSTYLGGMGANRGVCTQPCRRLFTSGKDGKYIFSLKDNELINQVPKLKNMGVSSIKIEGRLKSAAYVYRVAQAYRMVLDNPKLKKEAQELLDLDFGRTKTSYFMGGDTSSAITDDPTSGILLGKVIRIQNNNLIFSSHLKLEIGSRIRVRRRSGEQTSAIKVKEIEIVEDGIYSVDKKDVQTSKGDKIFLVGLGDIKFPDKFKTPVKPFNTENTYKIYNKASNEFKVTTNLRQNQLFVRVGSLAWLRKIRLEAADFFIIRLSKREWSEFRFTAPFLQKNSKKIFIELPKYISEKQIPFWRELCITAYKNGFNQFMLSHISQKELLPKGAKFSTNENVYAFNDAAISQLKSEGSEFCIYPLENDYPNLKSGKDRGGVVPLYFHPELFFSRMPVKLDNPDSTLKDDTNNDYRRVVRDGMTIIVPENPVAVLQQKDALYKDGFRRFLLDFSYNKPSKNVFNTIIQKYKYSDQQQPSTSFNFKKGFK